jgi:hypothetical protein
VSFGFFTSHTNMVELMAKKLDKGKRKKKKQRKTGHGVC